MRLLDLPPEVRDKALARIGLTLEQYKAQKEAGRAEREILIKALKESSGDGVPDEPERFHDEIGYDVIDDE